MLTHLIIVEYNLSNKLGAEGAKLHIYLDRLTFRVPLRRQRLKAPAMEGAPASVHRLRSSCSSHARRTGMVAWELMRYMYMYVPT